MGLAPIDRKVQETAKFIVTLMNEAGHSITHLKLQKLLYYCQGRSLAILGKEIFSSDFEARVNGPVCREVYQEYCGYGFAEIKPQWVDTKNFDETQTSLISEVVEKYGPVDARDLVGLTHKEKPWIEARAGCDSADMSTNKITKESMKSYFRSLIAG